MRPIVICLTPVRNEAWILDRFLKAASLWADHIIIADQKSTDGSREIALKYPKVKLIDNHAEEYNESIRQKLLLSEARKIEGQRLLITLDADEILSPNLLYSEEWQTVINSKPSTILLFQWANFCPDIKNMWIGRHLAFGYMDDGYLQDSDNIIHNPRIPHPPNAVTLYLNQIKVIHFQYINWQKMISKQMYYQCLEKINYPNKYAIDIFRMYHHMYTISKEQKIQIPITWISDYNKLGINITSFCLESKNWYELQILKMIKENGASFFRRLKIWDINWKQKAESYNIKHNINIYNDPRNMLDKAIQHWLMKSQMIIDERKYRKIDDLIKRFFNY